MARNLWRYQVCYTKKLATDIRFEYLPTTHGPAPLTVIPKPSTLNPQPSTLNPKPSTLNPQPQNS